MIGRSRTLARTLSGALAGRSARSSSWSLLGQAGSALLSMANFVLLARLVGPSDFGLVAGALGLVYTIGPFATLGADKLVVRDVASERKDPALALTTGLVTFLGGGVAATVMLAAVQWVLLPQVPLALLLSLAVAELIAAGAMLCCISLLLATGQARSAGVMMIFTNAAKVAAVSLLLVTDGQGPTLWAAFYAAFATAAAVWSVFSVYRRIGAPRLVGYRFVDRARQGFPFSLNVVANQAQSDFDKVILVRAGFFEAAGLYGAAYRVINLAMLPIDAVMIGIYTRFFEVGSEGGIRATRSYAARLLRPLVVYAVAVAVAVALTAPLVPLILGEEYGGAVGLLALLAPLVLLRVVQYLPSEALTGAGHQTLRTKCIVVSSALNVVLCLALIPRYGLSAAVIVTYVTELLYAALVILAVRRASHRQQAERIP